MMSPALKSKSKDKKALKEYQKTSSKPSGPDNAASGIPISGYNPLLGKFHTIETAPVSSASPLQINGRFRTIDEMDDHSGNSLGTGIEYDTVSNNDSWSGESEDHKEKTSHQPLRQEATLSGADNDKREKIRQKNEKKHQRQKERRALELHERCRGFLMSRKLEALTQQLVVMGFSSEQATRALILNEGKIEESVTWLFEEGEAAANYKEHNNLDGGNLKLDISEELAHIADMELRYMCSKQDAEKAIVACEGDLEKAAETLRLQRHDQPFASPKPEETGDPPVVSNGKLSVSASQNSLRAQPKQNNLSNTVQQRRDEKNFNYTKAVTVGVAVESGGKSLQGLRKVEPKSDWVKPQQIGISADKRWPIAGSSPSVSYSLASPPLATSLPTKIETRYASVGSEMKNLQMGSVNEPVVVMQRPRSGNTNNAEAVKPNNGLSPLVPSTRSLTSNSLSSNQLFNQLQYQHPQSVSTSSGPADSPGASSRGNGLWNKTMMGSSPPTIAAASSLGFFSGLGSNGSSGSSSPVDWNAGGSMGQFDYANIDWTLDRSSSGSRSSGMWQGVTSSVMQNNNHMYDSYASGPSSRISMIPTALANGGFVGLQDVGIAPPAEMSAGGGSSREWSSPFEERDLFSLPRQFVSPPSL
ncbi:hypothetical protein RHSIM_Rhsim13G0202400 [Rhododendron simsii]|uniref:UBA domain-containing protein n=1 Tax=Rhododendron simsii TaxID=118357 RepID=A0A834G1B5_RHOSS|nr:hypothetical protein RHSIM_Rhsim13G0202400 [Rhododendron simsii]